MRANFSEFSFGFAYTHELANLWSSHLISSPSLPSLVAEGRADGGYDVRLDGRNGFVYCAQFKLSEEMRRGTATEAKLHNTPIPYFRFQIYGARRSPQHELLRDLETQGHKVEYVAPLFIEQTELNRCFLNGQLRNRVLRVRPSAIGQLPDDDDHRVVWDPTCRSPKLYSKPVELVRPFNYGEITEDGFKSPLSDQESAVDAEDTPGDTPTLRSQLESFVEKVTRVSDVDPAHFQELGLDIVSQAQAVARLLLDSELLVFADEVPSSEDRTSA